MWLIGMIVSGWVEADTGWRSPPPPIDAILNAPRAPGVTFSPDHKWMVALQRPGLPPISELAEPEVELAGIRINPRTHGPSRVSFYEKMELTAVSNLESDRVSIQVVVPEDSRIGNLRWAADSRRFMFTLTTEEGIELWVMDVDQRQPRRLTGPTLNGAYGHPCDWLPSDAGLLCKVIPAPNTAPDLPSESGPRIEENLGRSAPARTYTGLLSGPHDEALSEYYLTSEVHHITLDGDSSPFLPADLIDEVTPSPNGEWVLVERLHRPWSYQVPAYRFPRTFSVQTLDGPPIEIADLPLADEIPIARGSVRTGNRTVAWRSDAPATLYLVAALDGGDASVQATHRDALSVLSAPFNGEPSQIWRSELRFSSVTWGRDDVAVVSEWWWNDRQIRQWRIDPSNTSNAPVLLVDRNYQDAYADPGGIVKDLNEWGRQSIQFTPDGGAFYRSGKGASPEGVFPFLDRVKIATGETERLWQSPPGVYEQLIDVLDADANRILTRRQTPTDPPNYFLQSMALNEPPAVLTNFSDPAPELAGIEKQLVKYQRADGVELSATLYLPPNWQIGDAPLPTLFWVYPSEHKDRRTAGQVTRSEHTFSRPYGSSVLFMLTQGFAVVLGPTIPIIGEGDQEPNDTYVDQLISGARAGVDHFVQMGVSDVDRLAIGGHSYGAFTAANLLAHTDIFRAGIARSGAYNRSLTPFGFQNEQRNYWEATEVYVELSPFTHAAKINEPLLLIHGAKDSNSGTYPIQSQRLYQAIKGLGGTVRWVELPHESHGYRSAEAVGHVHWEMAQWLKQHVAR